MGSNGMKTLDHASIAQKHDGHIRFSLKNADLLRKWRGRIGRPEKSDAIP